MKTDRILTASETWDFINPEGEEDEGDISSAKGFDDVVLGGSDWTAETILSQLKQGNILLNPHFQRREAWTSARQSRFIESLFLGLPVPQLVLAESRKERGKYVVIDGKQRLLSLLHFAGSEAAKITPLKLTGLAVRKELNGKTYTEIKSDPVLSKELSRFENQTIRTVVLKNWKNENFIYLVFLRLNTENVKLSPQELRQALHPGKFMDFAIQRSAESQQLMAAMRRKTADFRMRDVELFIRFFAFKHFLPTYSGNLKKFLDDTCEKLNAAWDKNDASLRADAESLDAAISATFEIFGENAFCKWAGAEYENRFNRAIYDAMVYYFSGDDIRPVAVKKKKDVETAFRSLCGKNENFIRAIETTTKSVEATQTRLGLWGEALSRALKKELAIPRVGTAEKK